jgi:hypothetical protein
VIDGQKYSRSGYEYVSQLVLVKVDAENNTLVKYGTIDHSGFYNDENGLRESYYYGSPNVRRSIFMGDYVYAFSAEGVTVTNYTTMNLSDSVSLPDRIDAPSYWGWEEDVVRSDEVREDGEGSSSESGEASSDPDRS